MSINKAESVFFRMALTVGLLVVSLVASTSVTAESAAADSSLCNTRLYESSKAAFDRLVEQQIQNPKSVSQFSIKRAARQYLQQNEHCYAALSGALNSSNAISPSEIDSGGLWLSTPPSTGSIQKGDFVAFGTKWGQGSPFAGGRDRQGPRSSGGTVTYSFMANGVSHNVENQFADRPPGGNVALTSLPGFQTCFINEIVSAFNLWSAVADINFRQVADNGRASNADGAAGDIRIGTHVIDGSFGVLAHAFFPPPNGNTISGDMHYDRNEPWTCDASGFDIGIVTIHEIGHAIGLQHEEVRTAIMNPFYDPNVSSLLSDDINGAVAIYGEASNFSGGVIVPPVMLLLGDDVTPVPSQTSSQTIDKSQE